MGVTLDQINQEVETKYGPLVVEDVPGGEVVLRSLLRLPKDERDRLVKMNGRITEAQKNEDIEAVITIARDVFDLVAVGDGGERLAKVLGDDLGKITYVLELYSEKVGLGEALPSDS